MVSPSPIATGCRLCPGPAVGRRVDVTDQPDPTRTARCVRTTSQGVRQVSGSRTSVTAASIHGAAREAGAKAVSVFLPHALALYRTPGEMGADLAVGEGMSLGTPPSFGGPALGLFTARQEFGFL